MLRHQVDLTLEASSEPAKFFPYFCAWVGKLSNLPLGRQSACNCRVLRSHPHGACTGPIRLALSIVISTLTWL